uniref:Uncharacterized protein n=1 Tax=Arundo donax TaxID=35708 RepID=A0A0A9B0F1_ARUDO
MRDRSPFPSFFSQIGTDLAHDCKCSTNQG